mmetsp:Transcript_16972/g.25130  ORF Transcript_16972/g.25130 Transcript_16972/m.25130 type:complete len:84 (+) Transcript_16972:91-342(+)
MPVHLQYALKRNLLDVKKCSLVYVTRGTDQSVQMRYMTSSGPGLHCSTELQLEQNHVRTNGFCDTETERVMYGAWHGIPDNKG